MSDEKEEIGENELIDEGNVYEIMSDDSAKLKKYKANNLSFEVPLTVNNGQYKVTEIDDDAFVGTKLKNLVFAKGSHVEYIGEYAFEKLKSVILPKGIKVFPDNISKDPSIAIEGGKGKYYVQTIEKDLYKISPLTLMKVESKVRRTRLLIRESVTGVFSYAMCNHPTITQVFFPSSIQCIDDSAFSHCKFIDKIKFCQPSQLKTIGDYSFLDCCIDKLYLPASLTSIGYYAFSGNYLRHVVFSPNSELEIIQGWAFQINYIDDIKIPESVNFIGNEAFSDNHDIEVIFPRNSKISELGKNIFKKCNNCTIKCTENVKDILEENFKNDDAHVNINFNFYDE